MVLYFDKGIFGHPNKWVLLDKNRNKVLKIFGRNKPTKKQFLKEERRIQYFKNYGVSMFGTGEPIEESTRPQDLRHSFKRSRNLGKKEKDNQEVDYLMSSYDLAKKEGDAEAMGFLKEKGRRYDLNFGSRPIIVRSHLRKNKKGSKKKLSLVKRYKKKGTISVNDRKIFELMSSKLFKKERGGFLDFGKKNTGTLEKFDVTTGNAGSVDMPADYEAVFHVHPHFEGKTFEISGSPSPGDMAMLLKTPKMQASVIFHKGNSYSVIKTPLTRKLNKLSNKQIMKRYDIESELGLLNQLKRDGFIVKKSKKGTKLNLPIKIINIKGGR